MTETPGISCGYWKARNMPALARSSAGHSVTSSPWNVIVPAVTSYSGEPISVLPSVLLPEPLGPMMACTSPGATDEVEAPQDLVAVLALGGAHVQIVDPEQRRSWSILPPADIIPIPVGEIPEFTPRPSVRDMSVSDSRG